MFEKNELKVLEKRIEALENLTTHLLLPSIGTALDEGFFGRSGALGNHPIRLWINLKLQETNLPDEVRLYLKELFEKTDFSNYRPLRR